MTPKEQQSESNTSEAENDAPAISASYLFLIMLLVQLLSVLVLRFVGNSMYPFFIIFYFWVASYIAFFAALIIELDSVSIAEKFALKPQHYLILVIGLTALFRLILVGSDISISLDPQWYLDFGKFMKMGKMPYADFYFPYPPVFAYFIYPISLFFPSVDAFRLLATLFDIFIVSVFWMLTNREQDRPLVELIPLGYALFPISIIESGVNGHFESIANLFLLLAIVLVMHSRARGGGAFLGLSAATKVYGAFLLPVLLPLLDNWRKRAEFIFAALIVAGLTFIPMTIPVWIRGDLIVPGFSVPGSMHSGFIGSLLDAIPLVDPLQLGLSIIVGAAVLVLVLILASRGAKRLDLRKAFSYDILTLLLGIVFLVMALIAAIYPLTTASLFVFWRYPADIGIVRGILTIAGALLILRTAWMRWKKKSGRTMRLKQVIILASTVVLILLSLFTDVFYGWYLLWCLPSLFLLRDRRIMLATVICLLVIYPGYTHDNFASLGIEEEKQWTEDFDSTADWEPPLIKGNNSWEGNFSVASQSDRGIATFAVRPYGAENDSALAETSIEWTKDAVFAVEPQDEFVIRISVNWDPTFERYADVGITFSGHDARNNQVNGTLLPFNYSPTNLTFVLYRRAFYIFSDIDFPIVLNKISLGIHPLAIEDIEVYIDIMYLTEYKPMGQMPFLLIPLLLVPNIMVIYMLKKRGFRA